MTFQKVGLQEMLDSADPFVWLQGWYYATCDGDWEHQYGIKLSNCDNPGWLLEIDVTGTSLEDAAFDTVIRQRNEHDWVHCNKSDLHFYANGGPTNLTEILNVFREWASPYLEVREYLDIYDTGGE